MSVKNFLLILFFAVSLLNASEMRVVNTSGPDMVFRALLIEKSLRGDGLKCVVTQDTFDNAVKKLISAKADIVLVKDDGRLLKNLPQTLERRKFAETRLAVFVNPANPVVKMSFADLKKVWNGDIERWSHFNGANIFSIHRFGMMLDSGEFEYIRRNWDLRAGAEHFPLGSAAQIIAMTAGNPNAIGIAVWEKSIALDRVKLVELLDEKGKSMLLKIPHYVIYRKADRIMVEKFLQKQD